jgi:hypothetical protein
MTDPVLDQLERANPVPLDRIGALREEEARRLLAAITAPPARPQPRPRRRRLRLLLPAALALAVVGVLLLDPFGGRSATTPAAALAEAADALGADQGWHVVVLERSGIARTGREARLSTPVRSELWHAPDGRLRVEQGSPANATGVGILYTSGRRQVYSTASNTLQTHRFVLAADERDEEQAYALPDAASLLREAYRHGKVRIAGVTTLEGRSVYRLTFTWLGGRYTFVFDASRHVPLWSESRLPSMGLGQSYVVRDDYRDYRQLTSGPQLEQALQLPVPADATRSDDAPIIIGRPRAGDAAGAVMRVLREHHHAPIRSGASRFTLVRSLPGGGYVAAARIETRDRSEVCGVMLLVTHAGGEAQVPMNGCGIGDGAGPTLVDQGRALVVYGYATRGSRVQAQLRDGSTISTPIVDGTFILVTRATNQPRSVFVVTPHGRSPLFVAPFLGMSRQPPWATG